METMELRQIHVDNRTTLCYIISLEKMFLLYFVIYEIYLNFIQIVTDVKF